MNHRVYNFIACVFLLGLSRTLATEPTKESTDFSRYQIVIDRSPFGAVSGVGPAAPMPNFATRFQFVGLVSSNGGAPQAILFDKEANRTYFSVAGDVIKSDADPVGVKVVQIEQSPVAKVVLQQGLVPATLRFEERGAASPQPPPGGTPASFMPGGGTVPQPPGGSRRIPFRRVN